MSGSGGGGGVGALNCVRLYAMQRHITIRDSLKHQKIRQNSMDAKAEIPMFAIVLITYLIIYYN